MTLQSTRTLQHRVTATGTHYYMKVEINLWFQPSHDDGLSHFIYRLISTELYYVLSIPREIAHVLDLQDGGLCSIEIVNKLNNNKKAEVVLMAYKDTPPLYREIFDPVRVYSGDGTHGFIDVPIHVIIMVDLAGLFR